MASKNLGTVVLDPGHGGPSVPPKLGGSSWNNAKSISGVLEKTLALDFCTLLKDELEDQASAAGETVQVFLTRDKDVNVSIKNRAGLAGKKKAKLFLSFHFNGFDKPSASGCETYFAAKTNGNTNEAADKKFAEKIHEGLLKGLKAVNPATKDRGVKPDTLSGPGKMGTLNDLALGNNGNPDKCLAAYIEAEFITNPTVEAVLISGPAAKANQRTVMASVAKSMLEQLRAMA